ncbi:MAG: flagellar basal body P-ring formation protein FlgA [Rhodobacter sp.]|uniref:flagellar basal body P-ring formation chaperone FlgA n=1 Tax=Pararhodobacter sp. TaxID=2127056 RepID=UPI001E072B89|nr:flagellar basal body P-ring formation chaperone FlgA [Pararhodobacter sp.]MCB1346596.1 flagellar basal body P-ring formation protein FlgA [Paracoccaceae bacterium]MCC0072839.1 flagellar basal body P-ring formation protein FlgA [Rhodobacter sp.]HPD90947.1 flagellar basal body P-ring formation chaperone FlgA [Pararhodobacter sp.]
MRVLILLLVLAAPAQADVLLAGRTLRAGTLVEPADVVIASDSAPPGAATTPDEAIGLEARVTLYAGRPIPLASLGPPAVVERNQLVTLIFRRGGLDIRADGRALGRGAEGDAIRIMNLGSRSTVSGTVTGPGLVSVP